LNLPSDKTTQVAFYLPNFDTGRTEVEFWDLNTNALLTSITCDKLWDGCYLVYELSGNINVQIAFNVISMGEDGYGTTPKGTMPRYVGYKCTDYEYALNQVAPQYGGGTEI